MSNITELNKSPTLELTQIEKMGKLDAVQNEIWLGLCSRAYVRAMGAIQRHRAQIERDVKDGLLPREYRFWLKNSTNLRCLQLILEGMYGGRPIAKAAIARDLNISRPAITKIFQDAQTEGLLDENEEPTDITLSVGETAMRRLLLNTEVMRYFSEFVSRANIAKMRYGESEISGQS